jgi:hypothetical protein
MDYPTGQNVQVRRLLVWLFNFAAPVAKSMAEQYRLLRKSRICTVLTKIASNGILYLGLGGLP